MPDSIANPADPDRIRMNQDLFANNPAELSDFHLILIKPTHYDDDGYPIQWLRSNIPANTLACLYGLAVDCRDRSILGPNVKIHIQTIDETNERLRPMRILNKIPRQSTRALVALVGVQSNQFPRAMDIASQFIAHGIQVCVGGFHVAGCLSMLKEMPEDLKAAQRMGVSFFAGEAEPDRLDEVIRDASAGKLKRIYNFLKSPPDLSGTPFPILPRAQVERTYGVYSSFDLGRGCPFLCSFCTIINVQGRSSRFRSADDLEKIIRANHAMGVNRFFLSDDNLARNRNWEPCFDRLIELKEREGITVRLLVQVDMMCHRIPGFIEKAVAAGVDQIFIGLESVNPENLLDARKKQNRAGEFRAMLLSWKRFPVVITAGYIIGFPRDTKESILRDVETLKHDLPIDVVYFTYLTPLPGSEDHRRNLEQGVAMESDMNKYDLNHRITHHPLMSDREWEQAYEAAWESFYTFEHMTTVLRRMVALRSNKKLTTIYRLVWHREFRRRHGVHPLEGGFFRRKFRRDRRPSLPLENTLLFYSKYISQLTIAACSATYLYLRLRLALRKILRDPKRLKYRDAAIYAEAREG